MEVLYLCVSMGFTLILTIFSFLFLFHKHRSNFTAANLPPGRIGWPVIGESLSLLSDCSNNCPEKFFSDREASGVFKTSLLGEPTAVLCGAAGNKFLFSSEGTLVTSWFPSNLAKLFPYSAATVDMNVGEPKKVRKLIMDYLRPEALRRHIGVLDTLAQAHFEAEWEGRRTVMGSLLTKRFTFRAALKVFVSLDDPKEVERLLGPFVAMMDGVYSIPVNLPGTRLHRGLKGAKIVRREIGKVIKARKAELEECFGNDINKSGHHHDIISYMLLTCMDDGRYMTELDILDKTVGVILGSYDSTSSVCELIVKYLAEFPHVYESVYQEQMRVAKSKKEGELLTWEDLQKMKYSWNVTQEVLRINSPAQGNFRQALKDFTYGGYFIPKGWKLFWSTHATHKNPAYFPDPEKFDPTRFERSGPAPHTFVPFGGGPWMCPGNVYARVKILVFVHNLVKRYRWEMVFPGEKIVSTLSSATSAKGLPIRLFPHAHV